MLLAPYSLPLLMGWRVFLMTEDVKEVEFAARWTGRE